LSIRPCGQDDAERQEKDSDYLGSGISLAIEVTRRHSRNASARSKDYMNWYGDIVAERMIVQKINSKEEDNVEDPATDGDLVWCKKEPAFGVKLSNETRHSDKKELDKCQKGSYKCVSWLHCAVVSNTTLGWVPYHWRAQS
jgi:hypothetical protein